MPLDSSKRSSSTAGGGRGALEGEPPPPSAVAKEEEDPRWTDAALARDYRREVFFGWGPVIGRWLLFFVFVNVFAAAFVAGARRSASIFAVAWLTLYATRSRVDRRRDGSDEDVARAYNLFGRAVFLVLGVGAQIADHFDDALSGDDSSIFNITALIGLHFLAALFFRFWWVPPPYRYATMGTVSGFFYLKPKLGVFGSREAEALAVLGAMALGEVVGSTIDGMQRENYVAVRRTNRAVRELHDHRVLVSRREAARERSARLADSLLNHTLKNVLADGISSVELYEQTGEARYLRMATQSMKHGMCWTRRRQSLIMVCQGTYRPRPLPTDLRGLVEEHANGRDLDIVWSGCQSDAGLKVEVDPMLFGLALENGMSNAIKHNRPGSGRPSVATRIAERKRSIDRGGGNGVAVLLEVSIRNNAQPGASFISEEVEARLFEEGMRASNVGNGGATNSSDGIGLGHAKMMAELLGGNVSLRQRGNTISYTISIPTTAWSDRATSTPVALPSSEGSQHSQKGQRMSPGGGLLTAGVGDGNDQRAGEAEGDKSFLDNGEDGFDQNFVGTKACDLPKIPLDHVRVGERAQEQQRLPQSHHKLDTASAPTKKRLLDPPSTAAAEVHGNISKKPRRGMFIDDSVIARKYASKMLMPKILGMSDWLILGENREQLNLSASFATAMKPDIVIMDENLEFLPEQNDYREVSGGSMDIDADELPTGSQICEEMTARGVTALLCIRSGNTSPEDVRKYVDAGAHCVICKSFANTALAGPLLRAWRDLQEERSAIGRGTFDPSRSVFPVLLLD